MSRIDDLLAALLGQEGGSPAELARALAVSPEDKTFRRALARAVGDGAFVVSGSTHDRVYSRPPSVEGRLQAFVADGPVLAHDFSDRARELGLAGRALGSAKLAAEIETFEGEDGRWYCRHVPGYAFRSAAADRGIGDGVARAEAFGRMSAVAARQKHPIGSGKPRE